MYKIIVDHSAEKDLDRLSKEIVRKIARVIDRLAKDPKPSGLKNLKPLQKIYTG